MPARVTKGSYSIPPWNDLAPKPTRRYRVVAEIVLNAEDEAAAEKFIRHKLFDTYYMDHVMCTFKPMLIVPTNKEGDTNT